MKRIIKLALLIVSFMLSQTAIAKDINQGTWMISGDLDLSLTKSDSELGSSTTDIDSTDVTADLVYYTSQNLGFGLIVAYSVDEFTDSVGTSTDTSTLLGPVVVLNVSQGYDNSVRLAAALLTGSIETESATVNNDDDVSGMLISLDYVMFLSDSVSFDFGIQYDQLTVEQGAIDLEITGTSVNAGFSIYFDGRY